MAIVICIFLLAEIFKESNSHYGNLLCLFLPWQAGQVYGVPLADSLLTKPGVFPEQRPCGEDFRKKWIEVFVSFPE